MNRIQMRDLWVCGVILVFSGCRFGNYADSPTQVLPTDIAQSKLFSTTLTGFETYVSFTDGTSAGNASSPSVAVPSDILPVFTNPVYWDTAVDGTQFFWDNAQSADQFVTSIDASGQINVETDNPPAGTGPAQFYTNPNCLTQITMVQQGAVNYSETGTTILPGTSSYTTVNGHLQLDITYIQTITGDCSDDLQELANCYQNGAGCDADQLTRAQMFSLFVSGTNVLNISDANKINKLEYIVHFD